MAGAVTREDFAWHPITTLSEFVVVMRATLRKIICPKMLDLQKEPFLRGPKEAFWRGGGGYGPKPEYR